MPGPALTFGFILSTLFGAGFHLIFGGDVRRLGLFMLAGWIGFMVGHVIGVLFEIDWFTIGALYIVPASVGALLLLLLVNGLTSNPSSQSRKSQSRLR